MEIVQPWLKSRRTLLFVSVAREVHFPLLKIGIIFFFHMPHNHPNLLDYLGYEIELQMDCEYKDISGSFFLQTQN